MKLLPTERWRCFQANGDGHAMGEVEVEQNTLVKAVCGAVAEQGGQAAELRVDTPGGRFQVRWGENGSATALGKSAVFAEFLEVSGLFERCLESCPLDCLSL